MIVSERLVLGIAITLALAIALGVLFLWAHALWLRSYQRTAIRQIEEGRGAISRLVIDGLRDERDLTTLRELPPSVRSRLIVGLSRNLTGEARATLRTLAEELGVIRNAENLIRSRRWWLRLNGARLLQSLQLPGRPFLPLLTDPHPAVRAQAAEWAGEYPEAVTATSLLYALRFADRLSAYAVQDALLRIGKVAAEPLAAHLGQTTGKEALPGLSVAAFLPDAVLAQPALRLCDDPIAEVRAKAASLLGIVGARAGTERLIELLEDGDAGVRSAAVRALGRMGHWPAAASVGRLLHDEEWSVRRVAALSLRAMGSPGEILLRRYRSDPDVDAAAIARQMLDLPAGVEIRT